MPQCSKEMFNITESVNCQSKQHINADVNQEEQ